MLWKSGGPGLVVACVVAGCAATETSSVRSLEAPGDSLSAIAYAGASPSPSPSYAQTESGTRGLATTRIYLGEEKLDQDFWKPVDEQLFLGIETAFESKNDMVGGEWGVQYTNDKNETGITVPGVGAADLKVELLTIEGYFGIHRTFLRDANLRPYIGAGISVVYYDAQKNTDGVGIHVHDDDEGGWTAGLYAHGGISWQCSENVQIGVDVRGLGFTDVNNIGGDGDLDYARLALFIGFGG
jgi:opacity protein-like surface antigen